MYKLSTNLIPLKRIAEWLVAFAARTTAVVCMRARSLPSRHWNSVARLLTRDFKIRQQAAAFAAKFGPHAFVICDAALSGSPSVYAAVLPHCACFSGSYLQPSDIIGDKVAAVSSRLLHSPLPRGEGNSRQTAGAAPMIPP